MCVGIKKKYIKIRNFLTHTISEITNSVPCARLFMSCMDFFVAIQSVLNLFKELLYCNGKYMYLNTK